jgi:hypothetical protein
MTSDPQMKWARMLELSFRNLGSLATRRRVATLAQSWLCDIGTSNMLSPTLKVSDTGDNATGQKETLGSSM